MAWRTTLTRARHIHCLWLGCLSHLTAPSWRGSGCPPRSKGIRLSTGRESSHETADSTPHDAHLAQYHNICAHALTRHTSQCRSHIKLVSKLSQASSPHGRFTHSSSLSRKVACGNGIYSHRSSRSPDIRTDATHLFPSWTILFRAETPHLHSIRPSPGQSSM